jgi:glycosyltransferase involved in cell wall biosynthesis
MRILIVAETVSFKMAGEPLLPYVYFQKLRDRGQDTWLICHERTRLELQEAFPSEAFEHITFIPDTAWQRFVFHISQYCRGRGIGFVLYELSRWSTQIRARPEIKRLVQELDLQLVFQPTPISPKMPSFLYGLGIPVVIGPLAGGMDFPPHFNYLEPPGSLALVNIGRFVANLINRLIPGKLEAQALIVSDQRTHKALPRGCRGQIYTVRDGAVDLKQVRYYPKSTRQPEQPLRFVFMARFVEQKGIRFLVEAFSLISQNINASLDLIGSGELLEEIQLRVRQLGLEDRVTFHGWMAIADAQRLLQECDIFVVPSIGDPGNIAMLEAMAVGMPMIVTRWGGVGEVADETCALMVDPTTPADFILALATAMENLAQSPELRQQLGKGAKAKIKSSYLDWDSKVDRILEICAGTLERSSSSLLESQPQISKKIATAQLEGMPTLIKF